jgi:CheY-like chemotaxis protein
MADSAIASSDGPLILVVDDHADSREMCATLLAISGFRTAEAANGIEALSMGRALAPDCILMDLSLPGIDGREATRRLKADPRTRDIPVIAVSGESAAGGHTRAESDGFAAVVTKPCTPESMLAAIAGALRRT